VIVRPLAPDFSWDEYFDLTFRAFGPADEAMVQPTIEPVVAAGRCLGAFDEGRLVGTALYHDMRQWWHGRDGSPRTRTSQQSGRAPLALGARGLAALYAGTPVATLRRAGLADGGGPDADAALDGAFAATPFMLDGF